jgi:hypothetical protein
LCRTIIVPNKQQVRLPVRNKKFLWLLLARLPSESCRKTKYLLACIYARDAADVYEFWMQRLETVTGLLTDKVVRGFLRGFDMHKHPIFISFR